MSLSKRFIIPSAISVLVAMLPLLGMSFGYRFSFPMAAKEPPGNVSGLAVAPDSRYQGAGSSGAAVGVYP
jgi:hypothetical protein